MPKRVSLFSQNEQLIGWKRAFFCGALGALFMAFFVDIFNMMGITPFSFEVYLGTLLLNDPYAVHNWTLGFFLNLFVGGFFGIFYAYFFEDVLRKSSTRLGVLLGFGHAAITALAIFPFFNAIHEFRGDLIAVGFGFFGAGYGVATVLILIAGHLLFGSAMGLFYGPVRSERVRMRYDEPGEVGLQLKKSA